MWTRTLYLAPFNNTEGPRTRCRRIGLCALRNFSAYWVTTITSDFKAVEQTKGKLLLSIQVFYDQTLAVRDHMDAVLHNVIHHSLDDRAGHADRVRVTCVGVNFIDPVPQDDHPHLARHRLLYPSRYCGHIVRAKVVLGRHAVQKQREGGGVVVSAII